jgi:hypothetical protein
MVRRTKDDGGTAVIEQTGNPEAIAARIAAADAEARRANAVADVEEWRRVVNRIADGIEPDGRTLAAIGDLARRLHLPPDAVARSVKAVQDERRLQGEVDSTKSRIKDVKAREDELAQEIKAVEARLRELTMELNEYRGLHAGYPYQAQAVAAIRGDNPLLFAPVEAVAARLVAANAGMSTDVLKPMVPQAARLDGLTHATWST